MDSILNKEHLKEEGISEEKWLPQNEFYKIISKELTIELVN